MSDDLTPQEGAAPAPEAPAGPDWSSFEQAGITPDTLGEVQNALNLSRGLNNLDTRHQYLQQVVNPAYDGQFLRGLGQPQEEPDPWAHLREPGEPEYYEPPQVPGFDPSQLPDMLDPVFQQNNQQVVEQVFSRLNEMAMQQAVTDATQSAVQSAGLPPVFSGMVEGQVRQMQQQYPQRQPADLAREIVEQVKGAVMGMQATPSATPPPAPGAGIPAGPVPSGQETPKSFEEAARMLQAKLR